MLILTALHRSFSSALTVTIYAEYAEGSFTIASNTFQAGRGRAMRPISVELAAHWMLELHGVNALARVDACIRDSARPNPREARAGSHHKNSQAHV
jgi:hypothetical protein